MAKLVKVQTQVEGMMVEKVILAEEPTVDAWQATERLTIVGRPQPRVDGAQRANGQARYTADVQLPGMLQAAFLRSPYPHADVTRVDAAAARALAGVYAVVTSQDAPVTAWRNGRPVFDDVVRYVGDEVAAVAAESPELARQACQLIVVQYQPRPFVLDPEQALDPAAPQLYAAGNLLRGEPRVYERGDVEKGMAAGGVVVEGVFETPAQVHNALETHGSVAVWEGDQLTIYDSTANLHGVRDAVAGWLDLPKNKVRVVQQYVGGSFGGKNSAGKYTLLAALLARRTGRPVRFFLDRDEENIAAGCRPRSRIYLRLAARLDGTLTAIDLRSYTALGGYASWAPTVGGPARELYACENVRTKEYHVFTNSGPWAAFRAPGYVEGIFALETLLDELAVELGLDPLEIRRANNSQRSPVTGKAYSAKGLLACYEEGARLIGWHHRHPAGHGRGSRRRGVGMASQIWSGGGAPPAYAQVRVNMDTSATVVTGTQDVGTGTKTVLAQVAAEELGLALDQVHVELGDTQWGLYSPPSLGSQTGASLGPAVREAAADARRKLLEIAGQLLEVDGQVLVLEGGILLGNPSGRPPIEVPLSEVLGRLSNLVIVGQGARPPNPAGVDIRTFGAQFAEVEVDLESGEVRVLKVVAVHDSGRILNPLLASSQVEGGIIQGLGFALTEQQLIDERDGRVVNPNLGGYKVPTIQDVPELVVRLLNQPDMTSNNLGMKGLGEPPIIPTAPAVVNAVYNATGVTFHQLPLTRDRVLNRLAR